MSKMIKSTSSTVIGVFEQYSKDLIIFQAGMENLQKGTQLLKETLEPTFLQNGIALFSVKLAEKLRTKSLLNIDFEESQKNLLAKTDETLKSLNINLACK